MAIENLPNDSLERARKLVDDAWPQLSSDRQGELSQLQVQTAQAVAMLDIAESLRHIRSLLQFNLSAPEKPDVPPLATLKEALGV